MSRSPRLSPGPSGRTGLVSVAGLLPMFNDWFFPRDVVGRLYTDGRVGWVRSSDCACATDGWTYRRTLVSTMDARRNVRRRNPTNPGIMDFGSDSDFVIQQRGLLVAGYCYHCFMLCITGITGSNATRSHNRPSNITHDSKKCGFYFAWCATSGVSEGLPGDK